MSLGFSIPFADALAAWRRDRELLLPLAAAAMALPWYAVFLLVPEQPRAPQGEAGEAAMAAWAQATVDWVGSYGGWYLLAQAVALLGMLTVMALYLDRGRPALGGAAARGAALLLRYILATLLISFPTSALALPAFLVPALFPFLVAPICYIMGRTMLTGPVLVVEAPVGAVAAVTRSWQATRGQGWKLAGIYATPYLGSYVASGLFLAMGALGGEGDKANPVAVAITDGLAAISLGVGLLTLALVEVAVYRRLASKGT